MDENKHYKAKDIEVDGPFDGWIIEEMDDDEREKEEAKQKMEAAAKAAQNPAKLSPEEAERKRKEKLDKIKELINQKKAEKAAAPAAKAAPVNDKEAEEEMLKKKSKDTGIPIEVLRMIEEKKKELRAKSKPNGGGNTGGNTGGNAGNKPNDEDPKKKGDQDGVEMADTVKARREKEAAEKYRAERQGKPAPKKKAPTGEDIGDRQTIYKEPEAHDLYNVMSDVGIDEDR